MDGKEPVPYVSVSSKGLVCSAMITISVWKKLCLRLGLVKCENKYINFEGKEKSRKPSSTTLKRIRCIAQRTLAEGRCLYCNRKTDENTFWKRELAFLATLLRVLEASVAR